MPEMPVTTQNFHGKLLAVSPSQFPPGGDRFRPGSSVENPGGLIESAVGCSEKVGAGPGVVVEGVAGKAHPASHHSRARGLVETFEDHARTDVAVNTANSASTGGGGAGDDKEPATDCCSGGDNVGRGAGILRTQSPYIGALGYYVGEDSGPSRLATRSCEPFDLDW